ncbi:MAG: glucosaminidase domain-containing protein [Bacteroidaceae bacterium]|nr:glucosaminidase domain-containing protein [Bacteroidaceae bacterium]
MANSTQQYINQYAEYAMEQMRRYGIPASITLAQGLVESGNGNSRLARTANNHFGVKGTFNGAYVLANDDKPNEKFKKYDNVGQSYEDHSKVLMARRYQQYVGGLAHDDYRGWAAGIKKGGYATAPNYVSALVSTIERNNLQKYDQMVLEQMKREGKSFGVASNPLTVGAQGQSSSGLTSTGMNLPQGQYSMPVKREQFLLVTSPYGTRNDPINKGKTQMHHGMDIKTNSDAVLATENNGKVIGVDNRTNTGAGKMVTVEYTRTDGSKTRVQYMHLSQIDVQKGDTVNAGQKLGVSGKTGTRVTGEHLHLGVINISSDGKKQWVNPAAYLAELNQKGNLQKQVQYNGKDLLAQYQAGGTAAPAAPSQQQESSPEDWMNKLLSSDDAALSLGMMGGHEEGGGGLLDSIMKMFMTLLMVSMQMENKSKEEQMQAVTDALVDRRIDLSNFTPKLKSAEIVIKENGAAMLNTNDGKQQFSHELTAAEQSRLSQILGSDVDNATKQQRISSMIYTITISQQASQNYEQIASQQQSQEQNLQRK